LPRIFAADVRLPCIFTAGAAMNLFGHFELQSAELAHRELSYQARPVTDEGYP
jgi:hypothetical protein